MAKKKTENEDIQYIDVGYEPPKGIWIFQSKKEMFISIILFIVFLIGFIFLGTKDFTEASNIKNNIKDITEYKSIPSDNVFETINSSDALNIVKHNNVIMLFGDSNSKWVEKYAKLINEVALETGVNRIYYYNVGEDRKNDNASYEALVEYLDYELYYFDSSKKEIYAPLLLVKTGGVTTYFNEDHALHQGTMTATEYWDAYTTNQNKEELRSVFEEYVGENK